jgi:UDP-N-acetylmuramyl pentapeptide synthase
MISKLKKVLYFPLASYFRFFARMRLKRWNPRVIVVTGSNGKTTLFHLLEAQLRNQARFSHYANSSFGLPFNILGLTRKTLLKTEWISLFLLAPFRVFAPIPKESIFVAEADCDRPGEGKFLAEFLRPEVVLWVSTSRTHAVNFESLVDQKLFATVEEAIAYEFGYFLEYCSKFVVIDGDEPLQIQQLKRTTAEVKKITKESYFEKYSIDKEGTKFTIDKNDYSFSVMLPEVSFHAIQMCKEAVGYLDLSFDSSFAHFTIPPGRGSIFQGIKDTTIIDSCYNANLSSMEVILEMYKKFPGENKWAVIGDMLEQGRGEKEEHEKLGALLKTYDFEKLILLGPRVSKYSYPLLIDKKPVVAFENPKDVLDYLKTNMNGGEVLLFKGARFMEGIIENLLKNKSDGAKLSRREKAWEIRRKQWGL